MKTLFVKSKIVAAVQKIENELHKEFLRTGNHEDAEEWHAMRAINEQLRAKYNKQNRGAQR